MKFYIVNDCDRPDERHITQLMPDGVSIEYIHEGLRDWGIMKSSSKNTPMEDFGFDFVINGLFVTFSKARDSAACYPDGKHRKWQGRDNFILRLK